MELTEFLSPQDQHSPELKKGCQASLLPARGLSFPQGTALLVAGTATVRITNIRQPNLSNQGSTWLSSCSSHTWQLREKKNNLFLRALKWNLKWHPRSELSWLSHFCLQSPAPWPRTSCNAGGKAHHVRHAGPQAVALLLSVVHQGLDKGGVGPQSFLDVSYHLNAVLADVPISLDRRDG